MEKTIQHFLLQPARFRLDGGSMYGIIPKPLWEKVSPPDALNRIDLSLRLWLIKTSERCILIDTGIGDHHDEKFFQRFDIRGPNDPLRVALKNIEMTPEQITDVVITHLHFDHVGGLGGQHDHEMLPLFKNAQLHLHKEHYDYAHNATARDQGSFHTKIFDPLIEWYKKREQITWHQGQEGQLIDLGSDQLQFKCSHGHTPWLMHPFTSQYIYLADLIPTAHHVHLPWVMGYDIAPGKTTQDKEVFLQMVIDRQLTLIFEHDIESWGAKLELDEKKKIKIRELHNAKDKSAYRL